MRLAQRERRLLRDLLPVVQEPLQPDIGQGVLRHLLQDVERQGDDVRAELRGLNDVERMADRGDEDFAIPFVVPEDRDDLADHLHPVLAHVVEPADERADVLRARLRREDRLVRAEDQGRVDLDAFRRQGLNRLQAFRRHLNLHDDVLMELRELTALLDHLVRLGRRDLEANRAVDEGEDVLDHLGPLAARLRDERRVRRDAVEDAPRGRFADLVDVRGIEEDLDHRVSRLGKPRTDKRISASRETLSAAQRANVDMRRTDAGGSPMATAPTLWRHRDFLLLWLGQSISRVGDQFTGLAVPLIAIGFLNAGPAEMGLLGAAGTFPFLLFGLLVGVGVDRRQRRSVLLLSDLGRGAIILAIAALALGGFLHMVYLYVFSFFIGVLTVFFDVAYQAYLPVLVERRQLVDAN